TEENLQRVSELMQEIEPRLRSLRRQAKRMEEQEKIANEYASVVKQYYGHQYFLLSKELAAVSEKFSGKEKAIQNLETEIASFQKVLEKEEQQSDKSNNFLDEMDKKYMVLEEKKLQLLEKLAEIKGKLKAGLPVNNNFSEFRQKFEAIIDGLRPDNIDEIKQKLKELVGDFGEDKNEELLNQKKSFDAELEVVAKEIQEHLSARNRLLTEEKQKKSFLTEEEKKYRNKLMDLNQVKEEFTQIMVEKARVETRFESMIQTSKEAMGIAVTEADIVENVPADLSEQVAKLKKQLDIIGGIDEATLQEYRETEERYNYLSSQHEDMTKAVIDLKTVIQELDQVIKTQFNEAFDRISDKFSEYFRILFNGGKAQMTIQRSPSESVEEEAMEEIVEEEMGDIQVGVDGVRRKKPQMEISGIEIKATPPGKKLATIAALSGGERALTAIALLCAMLAAYPSPFVVLDEVDAALDEANSIRLGKILGTLSHQTQFITITHNRETMRQAHTLYGVTMNDEGVSKILSLKLEQAEKVAPQV
ncbi:MAG TPA: hypothetical protein VEC17_02730, partial [Candidatus Binatia bacterium]|nr:hypothetical protein [Candidatus Binatia bacterium]